MIKLPISDGHTNVHLVLNTKLKNYMKDSRIKKNEFCFYDEVGALLKMLDFYWKYGKTFKFHFN